MRWLFSMLFFVSTSSYVYNGKDAPPALYRFFVDMSVCGGAMISSRFMITAAHCVDGSFMEAKQYEVTTRSVDRIMWYMDNYPMRYPLSRSAVYSTEVYRHGTTFVQGQEVNVYMLIGDVAIVQLATPTSVCDDRFGPLALLLPWKGLMDALVEITKHEHRTDEETVENMLKADNHHQCIVAGFGKQTEFAVNDALNQKRRMKQYQIHHNSIVDFGEHGRFLNMSSNTPNTNVCPGDSGSPIFCIVNDYPTLISLAGASPKCGEPDTFFAGPDIKRMFSYLKKELDAVDKRSWKELIEEQKKCRAYYKKNGFLTEYVNRIGNQSYPPVNGITRDAFVYPPVDSINMDGSRREPEATTEPIPEATSTSPLLDIPIHTLFFLIVIVF